MTRDRVLGIIFALLGAVVAFLTSQLADSNMAGDIGPKVFPYISAAILFVCGIILAVRKQDKPSRPFLEGKEWIRFLAIIGVMVGYVAGMWAFGFVVPTFLVIFAACMMFGKDENVPIWQAALYAAVMTGIIYLMFAVVLKLRLPIGKIL